jgi:hypothetical protein
MRIMEKVGIKSLSDRRREEMGYWYMTNRNRINKPVVKPFDRKCPLCGIKIKPGAIPLWVYGKGFLCSTCYKRERKKFFSTSPGSKKFFFKPRKWK